MSEPSSAPAPAEFTLPGQLTPAAIEEQKNLRIQLCDIVNDIPGIVSELPKGITLEEVLTAGVDQKSVSLFSTFFWNKLNDVQRNSIIDKITVLFGEQQHARANSPSLCYLWPSHGIDYRSFIRTRDGANIIAPNLWLFLILNNCNCSFYSVNLVETFFRSWLNAIQVYFLDTSKSPVHTGLPRCNACV